MSDTFKLVVTIEHRLPDADAFFGVGETRDTILSYIAAQAAGSFARFEFVEDETSGVPFYARSVLNIVITSRADGATKMATIDNNLDSLPGEVKVSHNYTETDVDFG